MNKILFSEGGQPVYLDDLEQIQDNGLSMNGALLRALTDYESAYLINPYQQSSVGDSVQIEQNAVVYHGEIIPFDEAHISNNDLVAAGNTILLCIKETSSVVRTFKDGSEHCCRVSYTAYISLDDTGAIDSFNISGMRNLRDLMISKLFPMTTVPILQIYPDEGFSVSMSYKELLWSLRLNISVGTTGSGTYTGSNVRVGHYSGLHSNIAYNSPTFFVGGVLCCIRISSGQIYLTTINGADVPRNFGGCSISFDIPV